MSARSERQIMQALDLEHRLWRKTNDRWFIPYGLRLDMRARAKSATDATIEELRRAIRALPEPNED